MKRFMYILLAVMATVMLASCNKEPLPTADGLLGGWKLVSIDGDKLATKSFSDSEGLEVCIYFTEGKFTLTQRVGQNTTETTYSGTWTLNKDILCGVYSDGTPWSSTYKVSLSGNNMTLTSSTEVQVYQKI